MMSQQSDGRRTEVIDLANDGDDETDDDYDVEEEEEEKDEDERQFERYVDV